MKNLANCKPTEFFVQTNKIRKAVQKWITVTNLMEIRRRVPKIETQSGEITKEELAGNIEQRKNAFAQQALTNTFDILEQALEFHPQETMAIIALLCFVEPENIDDYPVSDYLDSIAELITNRSVVNFFYSLGALGRQSISSTVSSAT